MSIKDYRTNPDAENQGVWTDFPGFKVLIARASSRSNPKWRAKLLEAQRRFGNAADTRESEDFFYRITAENIVKGWQTLVEGEYKTGIEDLETGKLLPATVDNVTKALLELPDLANEIINIATDHANYREKEKEETLGN